MFNFSFGEVLVVTIVALLAIGPKQLPVVAEQLGRWLQKYRTFSNSVKNAVTEVTNQQKLADNEQRAQAADKKYQEK